MSYSNKINLKEILTPDGRIKEEARQRVRRCVRGRMRVRRFAEEILYRRGDYVRVFVDLRCRHSFLHSLHEYPWANSIPMVDYLSLQSVSSADSFKKYLDISETVIFFVDEVIENLASVSRLPKGELLESSCNDIFSIYEIDNELIVKPIRERSPK